MLIEILLLFGPGIVGVVIYKKLEKKEWDIWKYVEAYSAITFLIYALNCLFIYARGWEDFSISTMGLAAQVKYGILSMVFAVVLPVCIYKCRLWGHRFLRFIAFDK